MKKFKSMILIYCCCFSSWLFSAQEDTHGLSVQRMGIGGMLSKNLIGLDDSRVNRIAGTSGDLIFELESGYNPNITTVQQFGLGYSYHDTWDDTFVHALDLSYSLMGRFYMGDHYAFFQMGWNASYYQTLVGQFNDTQYSMMGNKSNYHWAFSLIALVLGFWFDNPVSKTSDISVTLGLKMDPFAYSQCVEFYTLVFYLTRDIFVVSSTTYS